MKNGYDQFFKNARKIADQGPSSSKSLGIQKKTKKLNLDISTEDLEKQIRQKMKMNTPKRKPRQSIPWKIVGVTFLGLLLAIYGFLFHDEVESFVKRIEVSVGGEAFASNVAKPTEETKEGPEKKDEKSDGIDKAAPEKSASLTNSDLDHLQKLNERKKELDAREEELNRVESELQVQKIELDKRMKELEEMRAKISSVLQERVKLDSEKVDTLVQMYSNMKAPQAAKIFETMDEDLAVEILGRMKKKNAADIMNLLKPDKAQVLSEMFAGYKRAPASAPAK